MAPSDKLVPGRNSESEILEIGGELEEDVSNTTCQGHRKDRSGGWLRVWKLGEGGLGCQGETYGGDESGRRGRGE